MMSEIQRLPSVMNPNPVHPNAKTTTQINNGTTTTKTNISSPVCRNCKTQTTPLWRRDETGQVLCNACGLFLKLHGRPRPISLKTDTIKSRNRIKQPNFSKSSGPNTPELKSKDPKISSQSSGKLSPGPIKKKSPGDSPLEPMSSTGYSTSVNTAESATASVTHSPLQNPTRPHFSGGNYSSMGPYHNALPSQVQSLHYPSSTPTQFAPGLQRITSPLLLSTTPSVSNARSSNGATAAPSIPGKLPSPKGPLTAMQAAGALENMSNELGPSATFKGSKTSLNGVSLMGSSGVHVKTESPSLSTPSSALRVSPPSLPALGPANSSVDRSNNGSPAFGPQVPSRGPASRDSPADQSKPSLPPIQHVAGSASTHLGVSTSFPGASPPSHGSVNMSHPVSSSAALVQHSGHIQGTPSGNFSLNQSSVNNNNFSSSEANHDSSPLNSGAGNDQSGDHENNGGQGNANPNNAYEVTVLKTRISELELVNDLYRTRIMELEAMEQAARLRESSMRKRLDDLLKSHGHEESSLMLSNTMRVFKREHEGKLENAKRQKSN